MNVRRAGAKDNPELCRLIAALRVELAGLGGRTLKPDVKAAGRELADYRRKRYPVFVAEAGGEIAGFLVCRVDRPTVWAEAMYVRPEYRRRGTATALYGMAEKLAARLGSQTVYNWVHPNNDAIIKFLTGRGYEVLNLVELRRPRRGETSGGRIRVGRHSFRY